MLPPFASKYSPLRTGAALLLAAVAVLGASSPAWAQQEPGQSGSGGFSATPARGSSQSNPILPTSIVGTVMFFRGGPSGAWFDPPAVPGFEYVMTGGSLFTQIEDFPTGFTSPFTVETGGQVLGSFTPGQALTFPNGGVSSFRVTGINPLVDATNPTAFPLKIAFNTPTADFTMQGITANATGDVAPEPGSLALLLPVMGVAGMVIRKRRKK